MAEQNEAVFAYIIALDDREKGNTKPQETQTTEQYYKAQEEAVKACTPHSREIYEALYVLFSQQNESWMTKFKDALSYKIQSWAGYKPLGDFSQHNYNFDHTQIKAGINDYMKFHLEFTRENMHIHCHQRFSDLAYAAFAKYNQPEVFEALANKFLHELKQNGICYPPLPLAFEKPTLVCDQVQIPDRSNPIIQTWEIAQSLKTLGQISIVDQNIDNQNEI